MVYSLGVAMLAIVVHVPVAGDHDFDREDGVRRVEARGSVPPPVARTLPSAAP